MLKPNSPNWGRCLHTLHTVCVCTRLCVCVCVCMHVMCVCGLIVKGNAKVWHVLPVDRRSRRHSWHSWLFCNWKRGETCVITFVWRMHAHRELWFSGAERILITNPRLCWIKLDHSLLANPHFKYFSFGNWREHLFHCGISYLLPFTRDVNGALKRAAVAGVVDLFRPPRLVQIRLCEVSAWFCSSTHRRLHQQGLRRSGTMTAAGMPAQVPTEDQTGDTKA